jgi:hypothetical protein
VQAENPQMAVITFLGAGSVVFTRELLADILSFCAATSRHAGVRPSN